MKSHHVKWKTFGDLIFMFHLTWWFLVINDDQSWYPNSNWERYGAGVKVTLFSGQTLAGTGMSKTQIWLNIKLCRGQKSIISTWPILPNKRTKIIFRNYVCINLLDSIYWNWNWYWNYYLHALMLTNLFLFLFSGLFPTSHLAVAPDGICWK